MAQPQERAVRYEPSDADSRLLAALAAGGAVFLFLIPCILLLTYPDTARRGPTIISQIGDIPSPRLQVDPAQDLAAWRQNEEAQLSTYGWVDRDRKSVRILIDHP